MKKQADGMVATTLATVSTALAVGIFITFYLLIESGLFKSILLSIVPFIYLVIGAVVRPMADSLVEYASGGNERTKSREEFLAAADRGRKGTKTDEEVIAEYEEYVYEQRFWSIFMWPLTLTYGILGGFFKAVFNAISKG